MTRTIQKQLAVAEDILHGVGTVQQQRGQQIFNVNKVDIPFGVSTLAQAMSQDPATYPRVRAGSVELQAIDGVYQKALDVKPTVYESGAVLTEANPYVYYASAIYERISDLPYTLTDPANDGLGIINPAQWRLYLAAGEGGNFSFEPKVDYFKPADLDINNGYDLQNVQYQPGSNSMWILARGSKLKLDIDYTEASSTRVVFTTSFLETVEPDTEIEVWANLFVPATDFPLLRTTFDDTVTQLGANNGQEAIEKLKALVDDFDVATSIYVTMEQFDVDAGSGGNDTIAFNAACAESVATGKPVLLLNKTYRIDPIHISTARAIKGGLYGISAGVSKIMPFNTSLLAKDYWLLGFNNSSDLVFKDFSFDCSLSADPVVWTGNYDTFTGARGLTLINCQRVEISNIYASNVMQATVALYSCNDVIVTNVHSNRNRGNFGDGFYSDGGNNHSFTRCSVYDFTRIGFVAEGDTTQPTRQVVYTNCMAVYGHDSSNQHGGGEANAGFWGEFANNLTYIRCIAYDTRDTGFRAPTALLDASRFSAAIYAQDAFNIGYYDCVAGKCVYGFVNSLLSKVDVQYKYVNCIAYDVFIGLFTGTQDITTIPGQLIKVSVDCMKVQLNDSTGWGILVQGGDVYVDELEVYYPEVPDWPALVATEPNAACIGTFGSNDNRPYKIKISNLKAYTQDRLRVESRIHLGFNNPPTEVILEDIDLLYMDYIGCNSFTGRNVRFSVLGTIAAKQITQLTGGGISASALNDPETDPYPNFPLYSTTIRISLDNVRISLPDGQGQSLTFANIDYTGTEPRVQMSRCRVRKDVTTGSPVYLNAATGVFNTANAMRFIFDNNQFINTGGSTSNPIVRSRQRETGGNTVNVQVMGKGNFKSDNMSANATAGVITTNFEVLPYDAA